MRGTTAAVLVLLACSKQAGPPAPAPPDLRLATDLPAPVVDTALRLIVQHGGPRAERVVVSPAGVEALSTPQPGGGETDVRWDSEPYGAIAAARRGELLPMPVTGRDVPPLWRDPGGTWVAVGGRAVVILAANDQLGDHAVPTNYAALTQPWLKGKVAIAAPTRGASLAHFAALFQAWGEARMRAWMSQLESNAVQVLESDDAVRQAVVGGQATIGVLASDEAAKAAASAARVSLEYPNQRSIGTFVWPTALSRPKSGRHAALAEDLAERLASREIEQLVVARMPGYLPLRGGIPVPPGVTSAANLVVVSVDPARIVAEIATRKDELAAWAREGRRERR